MSEQDIRTIPYYSTEDGYLDIPLTPEQAEALDRWQRHIATEMSGSVWIDVRTELERSGIPFAAAVDAMYEAVEQVVQNGPDEYL